MHQRHVKGSSTDADHVLPRDAVPTKEQRKRKRGKRRRPYKQLILQRLLSCGMLAMVLVFVLALLRRRQTQEQPPEASAKFELYTPNAPSCTEPLETVSYTLVTQLSEDRLWMMEYHCQRYHSQMSIAVYSNRTHDQVAQDLKAMQCPVASVDDNTSNSRIQLSILDSTRVGSPTDYPVNHLRNLAISKVQTSHIVYIDVDFWTSEHLYEVLQTNDVQDALMANPRLALVIPAFQLFRQCREWKDCREKNLPRMPYNLPELQEMFHDKRGHIFDPTNRGGHGSTLYQKWMKQEIGSLLEIPCLQSNRYEPFVVVRKCHELPPFQTAFSGYGKNKMTWMMQLLRNGYTLSQIGGVYLCHYPHLDSSSRQHWNEAPKELQVGDTPQLRKPKPSDGNLNLHEYKRGQVDQLFVEFRAWLQENVPDRSMLSHCKNAQDDDSKLWLDRTEELIGEK